MLRQFVFWLHERKVAGIPRLPLLISLFLPSYSYQHAITFRPMAGARTFPGWEDCAPLDGLLAFGLLSCYDEGPVSFRRTMLVISVPAEVAQQSNHSPSPKQCIVIPVFVVTGAGESGAPPSFTVDPHAHAQSVMLLRFVRIHPSQ